eukprot:scaffold112162_cov45-Phaeocystis_antarctica.AAC.2
MTSSAAAGSPRREPRDHEAGQRRCSCLQAARSTSRSRSRHRSTSRRCAQRVPGTRSRANGGAVLKRRAACERIRRRRSLAAPSGLLPGWLTVGRRR